MKRLCHMKEKLIDCISIQMEDLSTTNTEELGEAIDMIKDLSEAIYYCTVTEAMEGKDWSKSEEKEEHCSHHTRKSYMEHKKLHKGQDIQMQELEKYMQELTHELIEMIEGATVEERALLSKHLSTMANKVI